MMRGVLAALAISLFSSLAVALAQDDVNVVNPLPLPVSETRYAPLANIGEACIALNLSEDDPKHQLECKDGLVCGGGDVNGICCRPDGGACRTNFDCCSTVCGGIRCQPCKRFGESCQSGACCAEEGLTCQASLDPAAPRPRSAPQEGLCCLQLTATCSSNSDCCSGLCDDIGVAWGVDAIGVGVCVAFLDDGRTCDEDNECQSRVCSMTRSPDGVSRCVSCGELGGRCVSDKECCSARDLLCQKPDMSRNSSAAPPDGQCCKKENAICAASGECCSGTCNDATRRCGPSATSDATQGQSCAGSGSPCVSPGITGCCPGLQCNGQSNRCCGSSGSECTSAGDCCAPYCVDTVGGWRCSATPSSPPPPVPTPGDAIPLLEPIGNISSVSGSGIGVLMAYVAGIWPWLVGVGFGVALLQVIFAGYEIMMSGGSPALREQGKQRILWSIIGMLMLLSAAAILNLINPSAYGVS